MKTKSISIALIFCSCILSFAYVVKKGDTLWDLSDEFFENPFTWPELWENNPHIANPHLIYPGDSLAIKGQKGKAEVKKSNTLSNFPGKSLGEDEYPNGVAPGNGNDQFKQNLNGLKEKHSVYENMDDQVLKFEVSKQEKLPQINRYYQLHAPRQTSKYSPEWGDWLSLTNRDDKASLYSKVGNEIVLNVGKSSTTLQKDQHLFLFATRAIKIINNETSVDVEKYMHRLVGIAKIKEVGNKKSVAQIVQIFEDFGIARTKVDEVRALTQFPDKIINIKKYELVKEVSFDDLARITWIKTDGLIAQNYNFAVLDKGNDDGYNTGNGVIIWENKFIDDDLNPKRLGNGIVLSSNKESSTILIRRVFEPTNPIKPTNLVSVNYRAVK